MKTALLLSLVRRRKIDKNYLPEHGLLIKNLRMVRANAST
jgi:hypothetical protein